MNMKFTRRQLIAGAAGIGALSLLRTDWQSVSANSSRQERAAHPVAPCNNGTDFNIILHGLFLIEVWGEHDKPADQRIRILSPKLSGPIKHVYRAGSWKNRNFKDYYGDCYSNWPAITSSSPPDLGLPTLAGTAGKLDYGKSYFSMFLPWPKEIRPLRSIDPSAVSHSGVRARTFPLAVALRYGAAPADYSPINGCDWSHDHNFHVFAEPECKIPCPLVKPHGKVVLHALRHMFLKPRPHFNISPHVWDCKEHDIDQCPNAPGVKPEEEKSLQELFPCQGALDYHFLSVHLPMCASIILTPQ